MNMMQRLLPYFNAVLAVFENSTAIAAMSNQTFSIPHYKAVLREIYFYTRDNPQIQALAAIHFKGDDRRMVKPFLRHAISEVGHDTLALNDLAALGGEVTNTPREQPLPSTISLVAFPFYQIQHLNPVGYLGYLFFLEFTPVQAAERYMAYLSRIGVPATAQTFLQEHAKVDMQHTKWMEGYGETLIRTEADFDSVIYSMQVTGALYAAMLEGAMRHADSRTQPSRPSIELARA